MARVALKGGTRTTSRKQSARCLCGSRPVVRSLTNTPVHEMGWAVQETGHSGSAGFGYGYGAP